jgi:hypothetical protein
VLENELFEKKYGSKMNELGKEFKILRVHSLGVRNFHRSPNIVWTVQSRKLDGLSISQDGMDKICLHIFGSETSWARAT